MPPKALALSFPLVIGLGLSPACSTRLLDAIGTGGAFSGAAGSGGGSTSGSGGGGGSSTVSSVGTGTGGAGTGGAGTGGSGGTAPLGNGTVTVVSEIFVGPDGGPLPIQDLTAGFSPVPVFSSRTVVISAR